MIVTETMAREASALLDMPFPATPEGGAWSEEAVLAAFRLKARTAHPDAGGSSEAFIAVDRAKCILVEWAKNQPTPSKRYKQRACADCDGLGYVMQASGLPGRKGLRRQCQRCHGSGDADYDTHGLY